MAEGLAPDDDPSAEIAVNTVRDVFAEGVAYGIEEALQDAFREASDTIRQNGHAGCSASAVAFSGTHAWYVSTGTCRVLKYDEGTVSVLAADASVAESSGMGKDHPEYQRNSRDLTGWLGGNRDSFCTGHTRIRPGSIVLAATPSVWMHLRESGSQGKSSCKNLEGWLAAVIRETRTAYRRQGGALAGASCLSGGRTTFPVLPLAALLVMVILGVLLATGVFERKPGTGESPSLFATPDSTPELVMPLPVDSVPFSLWRHGGYRSILRDSVASSSEILLDLPAGVVLVGGDSAGFSPDTFLVAFNQSPNLQWENFTPGIYPLAGDTTAVHLAEIIRTRYPELSIIPLSTIVIVRENGVAEAARWLRELNSTDASRTGVVVETRSSVAGGAQWIRGFPVFVNGDREYQNLPGGFLGDSLAGIPGFRNPPGYTLFVIP